MADTKLSALTAITTAADTDTVYVENAGTSKKITWANIKATLKTYFDALYQPIAANLTSWAGIAPAAKQDALVSATNIKTINSTSILGSGDLVVSVSPAGSTTQVQFNDAGAFGGASGISVGASGGRLDLSANASSQGVSSMKIAGQYGDVYVGGYAGVLILGASGNITASTNCRIGSLDISLASAGSIGFASTSTTAVSAGSDTRFSRLSAGVMQVTNESSAFCDLKLRNLIGTGNLATGIAAKSANYTATANDSTIECAATTAAFTVTLPAASGAAGRIYVVKKTDSSANAVTIDANASETIDGATTLALASQYSTAIIQCNAAGTAWHRLATI